MWKAAVERIHRFKRIILSLEKTIESEFEGKHFNET